MRQVFFEFRVEGLLSGDQLRENGLAIVHSSMLSAWRAQREIQIAAY
jgi:hypothetical protein